jgi:hypothetical protein
LYQLSDALRFVGLWRECVFFCAGSVGYRGGFLAFCVGFGLRFIMFATAARGIVVLPWVIGAVTTGFHRACVGLRRVGEGQLMTAEKQHD